MQTWSMSKSCVLCAHMIDGDEEEGELNVRKEVGGGGGGDRWSNI